MNTGLTTSSQVQTMDQYSINGRDGQQLTKHGLLPLARGKTLSGGVRKWSLMLLGACFVLTVDLAPSPSTALILPPPTWDEILKTPGATKSCVTDPKSGARLPGTRQVYIFSDFTNGKAAGDCVALGLGHYPDSASFKMPDNWISSIKVGVGVRAMLFKDSGFRGGNPFPAQNLRDGSDVNGFNLPALGWNNTVSSIRVEFAATNCLLPNLNEITIWSTNNVDCVVLPVFEEDGTTARGYASPEDMGIADNSIWAIDLKMMDPNCQLDVFANPNEIFQQNKKPLKSFTTLELHFKDVPRGIISSMQFVCNQ
jgi:hypothetical protein